MAIDDSDRWCSPAWKLDTLKHACTRKHAAAYLRDFWSGWIAAPMLCPIPNGGWGQLTLACLAVEATAQFWKSSAQWGSVTWGGPRGSRNLVDSSGQLVSTAAFCFMFSEVFSGEEPSSITMPQLAYIVYKVFRCGLAHRGLSKDCLHTQWLGVIDGQGMVFKDVSDGTRNILSIDPGQFASRIDAWFLTAVVEALETGRSTDIDDAFKDWCEGRWDVPAANWKF